MPAIVRVTASPTLANASPLIIGTNRNHVHKEQNWDALNGTGPKWRSGVMDKMKLLQPRWGSNQRGFKGLYRLGHGPTDGRWDFGSGYQWKDWFEVDGKAQNIIPYDDIKHGLNEAVEMGFDPLMVVNLGTARSPQENAGQLAAYCNRAVNADRTRTNAARQNSPYNVKYWELGNEISWTNVRGHSDRMYNEVVYAQYAAPFAYQIRQNTDIDVKIAFCASTNMLFGGDGQWQTGADPTAMKNLIRDLLQNSNYNGQQMADAITFHAYPGWPVGYSNRTDRYGNPIPSSREENKLALPFWHQTRLDAVKQGIEEAGLVRPVEIWNTEMFPHYYKDDPADTAMFGALYNFNWFVYQMNNSAPDGSYGGMPIAVTFCMWQNDKGAGHNQLFYRGDPTKVTPHYRAMKKFAENWGSAILNTQVIDSPKQSTITPADSQKGAITYNKIAAASSLSSDGKTLYIMLLNLANTENIDVKLEYQNFNRNPQQAVTVHRVRGKSGWGSLWDNVEETTTNWVPSTSGDVIACPGSSITIIKVQGEATTAPNNGGENPTPAPPPTTPTSPSQVVTNPVPSKVPQLASIREAGASVTRLVLRWDQIETEQNVRQWFNVHQAIHNARALGGRILLTLLGTPEWASGASNVLENPSDWNYLKSYLTDLVERYKDQVIGYEIWSAPNRQDMFYPNEISDTTRAQNYLEALEKYREFILEVDPNANIVLGGIDLSHANPTLLLDHLYTANKASLFNQVALRAYATSDTAIWEQEVPAKIKAIRDLMASQGDTNKTCVVTGFAVGTSPHDQILQAQRVARALALLHVPRFKVAYACYDPFKDVVGSPSKRGLVTENLAMKPAYGAYRTMAALLAGLTFVKELTLGDGNWGLEFRDTKTQRSTYLVWTDKEENNVAVEMPVKSNQIRLISVFNSKYADTILASQKLSFSLKREVMIVQELMPIAIVQQPTPGAPTTTGPGGGRINLANAKFELNVNGLCYLGTTLNWLNQSQLETLTTNWGNTVGHHPYLQQISFDWDEVVALDGVVSKLTAIKNVNQVAVLTVTLNGINAPTTRAIASATVETETAFRALAQAIKEHGEPVFFRFVPDMNRSSNKASVANAVGMTANDYIQAYLKVYDLFRQEAVPNVAWVWCPHVQSNPANTSNDASAYYPGDGFVDWIGLDLFVHGPWSQYADAFNKSVTFKDKPVMICEFGVDDPGNLGYSKSEAVNEFFNAIELRYTQVKGLLYFDGQKSSSEDYGLDTDSIVRNAYQDRTGAARYITSGITMDEEE